MATVTFEIDDALYNKAKEFLDPLGGVDLILKAILEVNILSLSNGGLDGAALSDKDRKLIQDRIDTLTRKKKEEDPGNKKEIP